MEPHLLDPRPESSDLQAEGPTPSRFWGDQWLRVAEKVIKGLNHQLTNRVASLEAVSTLIADEADGGAGGADSELLASLGEETAKLGKLLLLYRSLPAEPFVTTEAVRLQDLIPLVAELHSHHADLRGVPVMTSGDDGAAPVLIRPSALLRSILVLLESCAGNAQRSGVAPAELTMTWSGSDERVLVTLEAPTTPDQLLFTGDGSLVHAVQLSLAHAHGSVYAEIVHAQTGERIRYQIALPTLSEARRIEREGRL
ncbi:MAG: hypothetical protein ACT4OZ_09185 [Gemmatimonadota bacterium]